MINDLLKRQATLYLLFQATIIIKQALQLSSQDSTLERILLVINTIILTLNIILIFLSKQQKYYIQISFFLGFFPSSQIIILYELFSKDEIQEISSSLIMVIILISMVIPFEKELMLTLSFEQQRQFSAIIFVRYAYLVIRLYIKCYIKLEVSEIPILIIQLSVLIFMQYCPKKPQSPDDQTRTPDNLYFVNQIAGAGFKKIIDSPKMLDTRTINIKDELIIIKRTDEFFNNFKRMSLDQQISTKSPSQNEITFLKIVEQFPQGVGIIKFSKLQIPSVVFSNISMLSLFKIKNQQALIEKISQLTDLQIVKEESKSQLGEQVSQLSPYKSFTFDHLPNAPASVRNTSNTKHTNPRTMEQSYNRRKSDRRNTNRVMNIFHQELHNIYTLLQKQEVKNNLKNTNKVFDLHCTLNGYENCDDQIQRCIEIKIFMSNLNDDPQVLILTRDVSHREYINILNKNNKAKSNQLNHVSHEFRTPLGCIITMLEACEADEVSILSQKQSNLTQNKKLKYLKSALQNSKYLLNLSNDLMDLAQIKVNKFKLNRRCFNLKETLYECIEMFSISAERKKIKLDLFYESTLPQNIYQDDNRIKQVIINIIGNAFKFTLDGSISIIVLQENLHSLIIQVEDTGIGIKEEDKTKLLSAFEKINSDESKKLNRQGVGLGLMISNMITKNLNKEQIGLQFESQYSKGTKFFFQLDITQVDEDIIQNEVKFDKRRGSDKTEKIELNRSVKFSSNVYICSTNDLIKDKAASEMNFDESSNFIQQVYGSQVSNRRSPKPSKICICAQVLIIDDNHFNIEALQCLFLSLRKFTKINYTISGELAIKDITNRLVNQCCPTYKMILLDLEMPNMNGYQTFDKIKSIFDQNLLPLTVFACSSHTDPHEREKCIKVGMNGYLEKPMNKLLLAQLIDEYLL